jgi:glyoxylase-like metal-dependent hydrolase (beta-lactamase superfamily II)
MEDSFPKVVPIRGTIGFSYLVIENPQRAMLIDCVFGCGINRIKATLKKHQLKPEYLKAIMLTHGHLDHCIHARAIQQWCGAPVICPKEDESYLMGKANYAGLNKTGGYLEALGRWLWQYRPPERVIYLDNANDETVPSFPIFCRIPLPGHTPGHSGYYIQSIDTLLAGDLFAGNGIFIHSPPQIFTADKKLALQSIWKAAKLEARQVFICHTFKASGTAGAASLEKLGRVFKIPG